MAAAATNQHCLAAQGRIARCCFGSRVGSDLSVMVTLGGKAVAGVGGVGGVQSRSFDPLGLCDHWTTMSESLRLTVRFEDADEGWILATIPEVPGAISQGRTRAEARENVIDALRVVLTPDEQLAGQRMDTDVEPLDLTIA
ncbi:MAG: type II toxin-antitoxin system HicB family antitoxin [Solirubrobacteraceae bacterium]